MRKKIGVTISIILILLSTSSCVTNFLWGARSYNEEITKFYIGEDGRYIVLIGPQYHYVFTDNSGALSAVLSLQQKNLLRMKEETNSFELDNNNNIEGSLTLTGDFDLIPQQDVINLQVLGFTPNKYNEIPITLNLKGRRYSAKYLQKNTSQNLQHRYFIKVSYRKNTALITGVGKAAVTPIAVTLDAALLIGKVAIFPFMIPYIPMGIK
jgi:hypothetical protein